MIEVKIKDRKKEVEIFRIACHLSELGITYIQADLILKIQERLNKVNGNFSIDDGVEIFHKWNEYWQNYYSEQQKNNNISDLLKNRRITGMTYRECFGLENPPKGTVLKIKFAEGLKWYLLWEDCTDPENIIEGWFSTSNKARKYANEKNWRLEID